MPGFDVTYSLTEVAHFRRLVEFVAEVELRAVETEDSDLYELVTDLRRDLLDLSQG